MTGYPLQSVLDLRRREEEAATARLANAMHSRVAMEQEEARRVVAGERARQRLLLAEHAGRDSGGAALAAAGEIAAARFVQRRRDEWHTAQSQVAEFQRGPLAEARRREETARQAHLVARRERETFEKHAARHLAVARAVRDRREDEATDELGRAHGLTQVKPT